MQRAVAPDELVRQDFRELESRVFLRAELHVQDLLYMQAVEGHAHSGSGAFRGRAYTDTTPADIVEALDLSPSRVQEHRQELIDEIGDLVDRVASGEKVVYLLTREGRPLLRTGLFRWLEVDGLDVLRGLYLGGLRDSPPTRQRAQERFGIPIGYGQGYQVDTRVMKQMGLSGAELARRGHGDRLEDYRRRGLLVDETPEDPQGPVRYMFVRHQTGPGASDDCAILAAGFLYNISVAAGVFLADAIDTLEKYTPFFGDQDHALAERIARVVPDLGLTMEDACLLAYLAATPEGMEDRLPDSSLRHFLQVDQRVDQTIIESHLQAVMGLPYARMQPSRSEMTNEEVYRYVKQRVAEVGGRR